MSRLALVTGGGGFLGGAIVRKLLERGDRVRSLSRGRYPDLEARGVECVQADLGDAAAIARAAQGCDVVFHVAARAGVWGPYEEYHRANVVGTENVLAACRQSRVPRLVFTSSPSVVFDGKDMEGADESAPYPSHYEAAYPQTKALAEQAVLRANGPELATVALRPHLIWGPGDPHLTPRILARARSGKLRRIGPGTNKVHTVYVDNAADAHLLAADRLAPGAVIAGKAYFIAQEDPRPLWDVINRILAAGGLPPVTRSVPLSVAYAMGATIEGAYRLLRLRGEPPMTRFIARELATSHWFNLTAAQRDLGYAPAVSFEEGMRRLETWLKESQIRHPPREPMAGGLRTGYRIIAENPMRISFDVDDTLVCDASVPSEQPVPWWARAWFPERLRRGTRDLMHALQRRRCGIWIYTTSYRSPSYLRWWFRSFGVRLEGAVNQDVHNRRVKLSTGPHYPPSKYPPEFGIDLHVDDLEGVGIEGKQYRFEVVVISPQDREWTSRILAAVDARLP